MSRLLHFFLCLQLFVIPVQAQITIHGKVTDARSGEPLVGVNIRLNNSTGTITDVRGWYQLTLEEESSNDMLFSYIGYEAQRRLIHAIQPEIRLDVELHEKANELMQVVVTASRTEQRRQDLTISTAVVRSADITANNSVTADDALNRTPGLYVLRGQVNIRGSSGFTYGVGSRVLMLLDGLPLLTAESGEVQWKLLPVESTEQIEVIKGAGSALYGSGALGGVIHLRTRMPGQKPRTQITWFNTFYDRPPSIHSNPWEGSSLPVAQGLAFSHEQNQGRWDFMAGLNLVNDEGYRIGEPSKRIRGHAHLRYRLAKGLYAGISASHLIDSTRLYTFWENDTNAFVPSSGSTNAQLNTRSLVDPYLEYTGKNSKHSLRNRVYRSYTNYNNEDFGLGEMYYSEYQFQHQLRLKWAKSSVITAGLVNQLNFIRSDRLYGDQNTTNRSVYAQWDQQWGRVSYGLGFRQEQFIVNGSFNDQNPVVRAGMNIRLWPGANLRASYGQGFRSPTVAEMFSNTFIGTIRLASDPFLLPEKSTTYELGLVQAYELGRLRGNVDVAWFRTDYSNMIEYRFAVFLPERFDEEDSIWVANNNLAALAQKYARFQPGNVLQARITGVEAILSGRSDWERLGLTFQLGYTFSNPINLNPPTSSPNSLPTDLLRFLRYRYRHLARADVELTSGKFFAGVNVRYNSVILNIDEDFYLFMPGLIEYRLRSINGDLITDVRTGLKFNDYFKLSVIVRNAANRSWMPVPGNIGEQRSLVVQMQAIF
jgi:outer membrane cobalamin receptor